MAKSKTHRPGSKEWYKDEIREMTRKVNERFWRARNEGKMTKQLKQEEARLVRYGGKPSIIGENRGETVGLGFHKKPSVERLKRQYQELKRFLKIDIWSTEGEKQQEDERAKAYNTFKEFHPDWSMDKWSEFVQLLGTAPTDMLQAFNYERTQSHKTSKTARIYNTKNEGFVEAFSFAYDNDVDLFRVMEYTYRDIQGKGFSQEGAIDLLKQNIKVEIADEEKRKAFREKKEKRKKAAEFFTGNSRTYQEEAFRKYWQGE